MDIGYVPCCPNCGHELSPPSEAGSCTKRFISVSCPRLSTLLTSKISDIRQTEQEKLDEDSKHLAMCEGCLRRLTEMYLEHNLCVRSLSPQETPQRFDNMTLQRNLMHVLYYGSLYRDYFCNVKSSRELSTDLDSESFVGSTEYTVKKIENDLKEKLLEECLKPENLRQRPIDSSWNRGKESADNLRMLFLNEARDNLLQRSVSPSNSTVSLECKTHVSPSDTTITRTRYDGSWKRSLKQNNPFQASELTIDEHHTNSETQNSILINKASTFTKSRSELTFPKSEIRKQSNMETQYSLRAVKQFQKKKKRKPRSIVVKQVSQQKVFDGYMPDHYCLTDPRKELHFNTSKATRKNWKVVKKPKTLKETGVSTKIDGLQTILENSQKSWLLPETMRQHVMYINPSRIFMKNFIITRQNTDTQCDIIAEPTTSCKCSTKYLCEKGCQYSDLNMDGPQMMRHGMANHQQEHKTVFQCHQHQVSKVIQSPCTHNPPCKLVPSCFQARSKYIVNYCVPKTRVLFRRKDVLSL